MVRRAFNVMLRMATKSLLPSANGAAASPVTFRRTISSLIGVEKQTVAVRNILPAASRFRFFSVAAAASNADIFRSIIDSEPPVVFGIPVGSPFEKMHKCTIRKGAAHYHYKHNGEVVIIYVPPEIKKNGENSANSKSSATVFGVCILKEQARTVLVSDILALDGEIRIHTLAFGDLNLYDDPLDCHPVPYKFNRLDEDLQAAFYKYFAVRGITSDWYVENEVLYFR